MKKIKSKLIYVNPSYRPSQRADRSPSPDGQHRSGIQKTQSPSKQVQQFYKMQHNVCQYSSQIHKRKRQLNSSYQQDSRQRQMRNISGQLSVSSRHQQQQVSIDSISQKIKLKSPTSSLQYPQNHKNHIYLTPKSKNYSSINSNYYSHTTNRDQFPVSSLEWNNQSDYGKLMKSISSSGYAGMIGYGVGEDSPVRGNKKSRKKLEVLSPSMRQRSKQNGDNRLIMNGSLSMSDKKHNHHQTPTRQFPSPKQITQDSYKIQPPSSHKKNLNKEISQKRFQQKDHLIEKMRQQLLKKQEQLKKMSVYVEEYEKLGQKNRKMEGEMGEILRKLVEMKDKQQQEKELIKSESVRMSRGNLLVSEKGNNSCVGDHNQNEHNQNHKLDNDRHASYNPFSKHNHSSSSHLIIQHFNSSSSNQLPQSQIQQQNYHTKNSHKKTFTDQYIKINDETDSLNNSRNNLQQQQQEEQSYKPNLVNNNNNNNMSKQYQREQNLKRKEQTQNASNDKKPPVKHHRKMGSVGARLKESLRARNQQFVASFDDSLLMNSSSSSLTNINTLRNIQSGTNIFGEPHSTRLQLKKQEHLKTQQTEGDSLVLVDQRGHNPLEQQQQQQQQQLEEQQLTQQQSVQLESFVAEEQLSQQSSPNYKQLKNNSIHKQQEEQQTTVKKPKVKYVIRKKQPQSTNQNDISNLIQTNYQLTLIFNQLLKQQQTLLNHLFTSMQKHQTASNQLAHFQKQFVHLQHNFAQLINSIQHHHKQQLPHHDSSLHHALQSVQHQINSMTEQLNQYTCERKVQERENKQWLENNSHQFTHPLPLLTKISSFGKINTHVDPHQIKLVKNYSNSNLQKRENSKLQRKQSISSSQQQSPGSPSFTYLQDTGSFLTQSFKLSQTDRSNPSHSKFNHYSTTIHNEHMNGSSIYHSNLTPLKNEQHANKVSRYENSAILINQYSSSESNLLNSSKNTSQFINQVESGRSMRSEHQKSVCSRVSNHQDIQNSKIRSSNSQVRINFDDLYQDPTKQYQFQIVNRDDMTQKDSQLNHASSMLTQKDNLNNSSTHNKPNKPIELMKSSFGPIVLQNEMSYSQKGDSVIGESRDHVSEDGLQNQDHSARFHNRPRQNSSINIFFSSDSISNSRHNFTPKHYTNPYQTSGLQHQSKQAHNSSQSSGRSSCLTVQKCSSCQVNLQKITSLETEASQMRKLITQITDERDGLKKLIKSKVEMIDSLEISLKELQSLSSLENIKSIKEIQPISHNPTLNYGVTNNKLQSQQQQEQSPLWYKSVNQFQYLSQHNPPQSHSSTSSYLKSKKMNEIQDVLALSAQLQTQNIPLDKIQSLKSIQLEIHQQLKKKEGFGQNQYFKEEGRPIDWGKGSFSNVDELREKSFSKTKTILLKLICVIRELIAEGSQHTGSIKI